MRRSRRPDAVRDLDRYRALTRERAEIEPVVARFREYEQAEGDVATANEMARDPELKAFAEEEHAHATARMSTLAADLQKMLLPKDPNDERNVFLEIRAGTGGDESALFAGSLFRMYTRYAERHRWQVEIVSESPAELGGYKEVIARIVGHGRVFEAQVRIGRSSRAACARDRGAGPHPHVGRAPSPVMPEADPDRRHHDQTRARCASIRSARQGAGGQHINKTGLAVRVTHLPSGIVVECQDDRSQHRNRAQADGRARFADCSIASVPSASRRKRRCGKSLIGSGDRSERVRTYNFPQGTRHRSPDQPDALQDRRDHGRRARRADRALSQEHQAEMLAALSGDER
jgi:peptide chain release factor 1